VVQDVQVHRLLTSKENTVENVLYTVQVGALDNATRDPSMLCYTLLSKRFILVHWARWLAGASDTLNVIRFKKWLESGYKELFTIGFTGCFLQGAYGAPERSFESIRIHIAAYLSYLRYL